MTSIRKLALVLYWAICFSLPSNAQQIDQTGNLINNNVDYTGTTGWSGIGAYSQIQGQLPNDIWGCCTSFHTNPFLDASTGGDNGQSGQIHWTYGQATVSQNIGVNQALSGIGIKVTGYSWGYDIRNMNGTGGQNGTDTITATSYLKDSSGQTLISESHTYNTQFDWTRFTGYQTLPAPLTTANLSVLGISFTSMDSGFWAGYYGPQVRNVDLRLNYMSDQCSVDPLYSTTCPGYAEAFFNQQCALNPLYNQSCPGYTSVILSGNLVPNPNNSTGWFGGTLNNSFAINTALSHAGSGVMIHGFSWGYRATNYSGFWGIADGSSTVNVNIRDGDGTSLYAWSRTNRTMGENWYTGSYVLPESRNNLTLGTFQYSASSSGFGNVDSMYAKVLFTPDSCSLDPLSSPLCTGYEAAFLAQQCSIYVMYSPQCPGYAEALAQLLEEQAALAAAATSTTTDPVQTAIATTTTSTSTTTAATADPTATGAETNTDVGGAELSTTGEVIVSDGTTSATKESISESTKTEEKKEETKVAETTATTTQTASSSSPGKKLSTSQLLAFANRAINEANSIAKNATEAAVAASQSENANPADGTGTSVSLGGGLTLNPLSIFNNATTTNTANQSTTNTNGTGLTVAKRNVEEIQDKQADQTSSNSTATQSLTTMSGLTNTESEQKQNAKSSVRRGGKVEGMEGGADMNQLASAPADFNSYLTAQLKDVQFYQSKDIYKGQKNVDNARLLKGLSGGSDALHQRMIDQQYGR